MSTLESAGTEALPHVGGWWTLAETRAQAGTLGRRERHKADKRARIIRAARARFAAAGYAAATTAGIATDADVAAGTLFQYAATKSELLIMAMNDEVGACIAAGEQAAAALGPSRHAAVMAFVAPLLALATEQEEIFSVFVREVIFGPAGQHRDAALRLVLRAEEDLRGLFSAEDPGRPRLRTGADLDNAARALVFAVLLEISTTRLGVRRETTKADRVGAQMNLILHGILDSSVTTDSTDSDPV